MKLTREEFDKLRDGAVSKFDFDKAAMLYAVLGWRWSQSEKTPTADEIRAAALRLFDSLWEACKGDSRSRYVSSGGLVVDIHKTRDGRVVSLAFVALDSSAEHSVLGDVRAYGDVEVAR